MAVSFWELEKTFVSRFNGKVLRDRNHRENLVPVFVDYPDLEEAPERRFPSISVLFKGMSPDTELYNTDMDRQVSVDYTTSPPTFRMRRMAEFYDISYEVTTYCLSAWEDRELTRWVESRFLPRDCIVVNDISYHVFRESFNVADSVDVDTVIYEKTWGYTIKADIEDTDNDDYQKGVNEVRIHSNVVKTTSKIIEPTSKQSALYMYNAPSNSDTAEEADKSLHRVIAFDDQKYWFLPKK
jgi:hypothetical protein